MIVEGIGIVIIINIICTKLQTILGLRECKQRISRMDFNDDNDDDDDAWYEQMERQGQSYGDVNDDYFPPTQPLTHSAAIDEEISEESYLNAMVNNACLEVESFVSEEDLIWQQLARQVLNGSLGTVEKHASLLTVLTTEQDPCASMIIRQWLFSFIPLSLKMYNMLSLNGTSAGGIRRFYVDNKLHPSFVATTLFIQSTKKISLSCFCPYNMFDECTKFLLEIISAESKLHENSIFMFSALDARLYEHLVSRVACFNFLWNEICDVYSMESIAGNLNPVLPLGFEFVSLR
jgi:hypothetical protein